MALKIRLLYSCIVSKGVRAQKFKLVRRDIHMRLKELLSISIHPTQYSSQRKFTHR